MNDIFDGWQNVVDGTETVTLTLKRTAGATVLNNIAGVLRRGLSKADASFGGLSLAGDEVVFNIPNSQLDGNTLEVGDVITDGSAVIFTLVRAARLAGGSRWRCICRKQVG